MNSFADSISPAGLCLMDGFVKEVVEEQILEIRVLGVGSGDVFQEDRTNDASPAPHKSDGRLVEFPFVFFCGLVKILDRS